MKTIRGVIFDVDGTLVDSNDAHAYAWLEVLEEFGFAARFDETRRLIGMGGDKLLPRLTGFPEGSAEGERMSKRRAEIFKTKYLPRVKAFPGSKELLAHMRSRGLRLVIASSAKESELTKLLEIAGAIGLVEDATSSNDAQRSKPDPDIVQKAIGKLGLPCSELVMIGDTPYDIEAAGRAGIRTIAFRSGGWPDSALKGAIAIYDGPAELKARYERSPFARIRRQEVRHAAP